MSLYCRALRLTEIFVAVEAVKNFLEARRAIADIDRNMQSPRNVAGTNYSENASSYGVEY